MRKLLLPFSLLYSAILWIRNKCYDLGLFSVYHHSKPTIGIGNLRVGGTGKTPMMEYILSFLSSQFELATLSRGYGRKTKGFVQANDHSTADEIGDEPAQVNSKFLKIKVYVDEERAHGLKEIERLQPTVQAIVLDDVFQHRAIQPGLNIMLTSFFDPFYKDSVLPAGMLRESKSGYKRADVVIVTRCPGNVSGAQMTEIERRINPTKKQKLFFTKERYEHFVEFSSNEPVVFDQVIGRKVVLLTGIARSQTLAEFIQSKYELVKHFEFPDHHNFSDSDLEKVINYCENLNTKNLAVITTEKDAQRLKVLDKNGKFAALSLLVLPLNIGFCRGDEQDFQNLVFEYVRSNS